MKAIARHPVVVLVLAAALMPGGCVPQAARTQAAAGTSRFPWVGNTLGVTDQVPHPWLPLKVEGDGVTYWGGRIEIGDSLLPSQITSQSTELLSRPVAFVGEVGGKALELSPTGPPQARERSDASVVMVTSASSGDLTATCTHTIEYDGMVRVDAEFTAVKQTRIDRLTLEIPVRAAVANYFRRFYTYDFESMKVDRDDYMSSAGRADRAWETRFTPYVWLGQPEVGLEWFSESDEAWRPWGQPGAVAVEPRAQETVIALRMIREPAPLGRGQSWQVTFGVSPTPSRPPVPDWRTYRWGGRTDQPAPEVDTSQYNVFAIFWIGEGEGLALQNPGMPWPANPAAYRPTRERLKQQRIKYIPYGSLFKIDTNIPEWSTYGSDWSGGRTLGGWKASRGASPPSSVCVSSGTFQDYLVWTYVDAIRRFDIDGLYFDFGAPGLNCVNPNHAHGKLAAEGIYSAPLFALRKLYQRLYVANEEAKPGFRTIIHGLLPAMCESFVDANVGGEGALTLFNKSGLAEAAAERQLRGTRWYVPDYIDEWPVGWLVGQFSRNVAAFPVLLPEITKFGNPYFSAHREEVTAYTRGMLALAAMADIHAIWQTNADLPLLRQFSVAKAKFGPMTDDVGYYPFWRSPVRIDPSAPDVYPTLYTRPDSALLILSNLGASAATVTVDPSLAGLGVRPAQGTAVDAMSDSPLSLDPQEKVSLTVPSKDFAIVLLR